jgi:hypothetical protein
MPEADGSHFAEAKLPEIGLDVAVIPPTSTIHLPWKKACHLVHEKQDPLPHQGIAHEARL